MGATAIGTGINADPDYSPLCIRYLREITGLPVVAATEHDRSDERYRSVRNELVGA